MKKYVFVTVFFILLILLAAQNSLSQIKQANAQENPVEKDWQLTITGMIKSSTTMNLTEIRALPATIIQAQLYCVDFPDKLIMEGAWTGVRLSYILNQVEMEAEASKIALYAADGYTTDLSLEQAISNDIIIAYEKDGKTLPEMLRLVAPGLWGYKWIAQITKIELVNYNFLGRWESFGYSDEATIKSTSNTDPQKQIEIPTMPDKTIPSQIQTPTPSTTTVIPKQSEPPISQTPTPTTSPSPDNIQSTPPPSIITSQPTSPPDIKEEKPTDSPKTSENPKKPTSENNTNMIIICTSTITIVIVILALILIRKWR